MKQEVTVHKLDDQGQEILHYRGRLLARRPQSIQIEATYDRRARSVGPLELAPGDRFIETFYADRWYNLFAVYDGVAEEFRGWYCNIARPARIEGNSIYQEDLALDLVVTADGEHAVLDLDEFGRLRLNIEERNQALAALRQLRSLAEAAEPPFDRPPSLE